MNGESEKTVVKKASDQDSGYVSTISAIHRQQMRSLKMQHCYVIFPATNVPSPSHKKISLQAFITNSGSQGMSSNLSFITSMVTHWQYKKAINI